MLYSVLQYGDRWHLNRTATAQESVQNVKDKRLQVSVPKLLWMCAKFDRENGWSNMNFAKPRKK
jgi:hypothetical protein